MSKNWKMKTQGSNEKWEKENSRMEQENRKNNLSNYIGNDCTDRSFL